MQRLSTIQTKINKNDKQPLTSNTYTQKGQGNFPMVIYVLSWDRHRYVAVLIQLIDTINLAFVNSSQWNCE
jgi:hypothetical protein